MTSVAPGRRHTVAILACAFVMGLATIAASSDRDRVAEFEWARGLVIDSIAVEGNTRVRDDAILREMELREGARFDPVLLERDRRFIEDLSAFASAEARVDTVGQGRCIVRLQVTERSSLVTSLVYPVVEYDFDRERLRYGIRWNETNFRHRLENVSFNGTRDNLRRDNLSAGWSTRWIGWTQLGVSLGASYFHSNDAPVERTIVEQQRVSAGVSIPLVDSRVRVVQLTGGLSYTANRLGESGQSSTFEKLVSPSAGIRYDSRDSRLRPSHGEALFSGLTFSQELSDKARTYYRVTTDARVYRSMTPHTVLALWSRVDYQFGDFPDYIRFGLGGSGTLRGYDRSAFRGSHRWFQTAEVRYDPWERRLIRLPIIGMSDFRVAFAFFVDSGIAWSTTSAFSTRNFHTGFGTGLRLYSPFQDVIRLDTSFTARGWARIYLSSGVRF